MESLLPKADYVRARLKNITVEVPCGLHPWEKHPERPNRLMFSIDLYAHLGGGRAAAQGFMDYDRIRDFVRALRSHAHVDLLETIVDEVTEECFKDPRVDACRISVVKPDIFNDAEGAGIEAFRTRKSWTETS
jgi:7,8-dihydroneopterin aldolase/epimerase/oxygenase